MSQSKKIVTLPGDGIGPEVTREAVKILKAACQYYDCTIIVEEHAIGGSSYDQYATPLTDETIKACQQSDAIFLGAVGGPKWKSVPKDKRPEAGLLGLREELGLFANLRPIKIFNALIDSSPLKKEIVRDIDILIVRELTGGIYFGKPRKTERNEGSVTAVDTMRYDSHEIDRIAGKAFKLSRKRNRRVCSVDKANVLDTSRLWRSQVEKTAQTYQDIELSHMLVDNCAMQLLRDPGQFDVILTGNLFGDILSDEAAMLTGSIGMLPSASLGKNAAVYEPVHGSAPDISGSNQANPLAAITSIALMCRYSLDMPEAARDIEQAIETTLEQGYRTNDIYSGNSEEKKVGTDQMGKAVLEQLYPEARHITMS